MVRTSVLIAVFIVAAGFFTLDGAGVPQPNDPLHNDIRIDVISQFRFLVNWTRGFRYRRPVPGSRHNYVVKAIGVSRRGGINVTCLGMRDDGIVIGLFPIGDIGMEGSGFMIEITQIGVLP